MRWSELSAWERRAELAKVHPDLTEGALIADGLNVLEIAPQIRAQKSNEDKVMVVLRYFGDEGHPQPAERGRYGPAIDGKAVRQSPPWGRLPRLAGDGEGGRPEGSFVETGTFWVVWGMAVNENASARRIAKETDERPELQFVNRDKAGVIVEAVGKNRAAARQAWVAEKPPRGFSATPYGIKLPPRKPA